MVRRHVRGAVLLLLSLLPAGVAAQTEGVRETRGWIGIQVEGHLLSDGSSRVMIVGVDRDSPAGRAGLRPDDLLLRLDGVDVSPEALRDLVDRIRPGTPVQVTVLRQNRERRMRMVAGTRPWPLETESMEQIAVRVDSARARIFLMVDSLLADSVPPIVMMELEAARRTMMEEAEAIREALGRTRAELRRAHMRRIRESLEGRWTRQRITAGEARRGAREAPQSRTGGRSPRFRSPRLMGERFVAGAEIREMEPGARVAPGAGRRRLQVVRIVEGSPAAQAGLAPSDWIVSVGGEPVGNLRELRIRLGRVRFQGSAEIQVVRGDSALVVILPR